MLQAQSNARADKILILDDDARIRDLLRRYLAQEGSKNGGIFGACPSNSII